MKFKLRVEPKDAKYFVFFLIFLLYVISLGVVNFRYLIENGEFYGLNPAKAFEPEYIGYTIPFYILAVVGIFLVVSSHFFEKEKGVGIKISEKEPGDGYERWAKEKEITGAPGMKKVHITDREYKAAGIPLYSVKDDMWVDDGESHSLIIGATGSGKTYCMVNPLVNILAKKGESMVITDPKGEIYKTNAELLKDRGYNIIVLNFREPQNGNAWNPLTLPYKLYKSGNSDKSNELLRDLAINILHEEKTDDPFWQNTAADFFSGLAQGLFQDAKEEEINLNSIILMLTTGEEKYGASNYMKEYFSTKEASNPAYLNAAGTINAPNETKGSIVSVFRQKVNIFAMAENLSEMLSYSDFDMMDIGKKKTAVFLVIQDEKKTYHALATIFVKQCYESLIDVAQNNNGKLSIRTNFILDEFANMPPLKDVTTMITAARSRQIRFDLIIQNFAQLNQVYGKENAETIKGNCGNTIYLLSSELQALKEISELAGERKIKGKKDKDGKPKEEVRPLITVAELQRLKFKDAIILKHRVHPFKTKLKGVNEFNWNNPKYEEGVFPSREKHKIHFFDLKEFVKQNKKNKLFEGFDSPGGNFPGGGFPGGGFPGGNQFFNPNPNPMFDQYKNNRDPFSPTPNANQNKNDQYNFDDLIKRIDAKIAELEEEEKNEQMNKDNDKALDNKVIIDKEPKDKPNENTNDNSKDVVVNVDIDKMIKDIENEDTTDDQFFDDFFTDE